jgi:hypothetical protein
VKPNGHPSDDRLVDLAASLLGTTEELEALEHLKSCPGCEARFRTIARGHARARIRSISPPQAVARPDRRRRVVWAAAAAAIALVGLLTTLQLRERGTGDGLDYWLPVDAERLLFRSGVSPEERTRFSEAVEAYRSRDTARVIERLQGQAVPRPYSEVLEILLASALVW